jgi:hypothetical protein
MWVVTYVFEIGGWVLQPELLHVAALLGRRGVHQAVQQKLRQQFLPHHLGKGDENSMVGLSTETVAAVGNRSTYYITSLFLRLGRCSGWDMDLYISANQSQNMS